MGPGYIMDSQEHHAIMYGRLDEDTVFVDNTFLVFWSIIMYALGTFTGMLLFSTAFMSMV